MAAGLPRYLRVMTRALPAFLVLVLVLVVALSAGATGSRRAHASFVFGRTGGNIAPFSVSIARDGSVKAKGDIRKASLVRRVAPTKLDTLLARARAASFFAMRKFTRCSGSLPDYGAPFLRISTSAKSRTVTVRGDCRPIHRGSTARFARPQPVTSEALAYPNDTAIGSPSCRPSALRR